jgi:hypothetical protein
VLEEGVTLRGVLDGDPAGLRRGNRLRAHFVPGLAREGSREIRFSEGS